MIKFLVNEIFLHFGLIIFVDLSLIFKEGKIKAFNFISYSLQPTYLVNYPFYKPDKEFKVMIIKVLTGFEKKVDGLNENFNKKIETIKNKQLELKSTLIDRKNTLDGISSRLEDAEEWTNNLEDRKMEDNQP